MKVSRPVLRYHGGKFRLAPFILDFFPTHRTYVEPFGGAASVLLQKVRVPSEVYNDLDGNITNVFRVLQDRRLAEELRYRISLTPFSRAEFNRTYEPAVDAVDAAAKVIVRSFMGHGSDSATRGCRTGFRCKSHQRALPSMEWSTWPEQIPAFVERLAGVVIEERDAADVIERYDSPQTLIYADPPYVHATRGRVGGTHGYAHELSDADHRRLAGVLHRVQSMVVISGYPSDLYAELYADWQCFTKRHTADRGLPRIECVWLNLACAKALRGQMAIGLET